MVTTPEAIRSSVCAQLADRSMSSGTAETGGIGGVSSGTGTGAPAADGGGAVLPEGPAQTCADRRTSDNHTELRGISILGDVLKRRWVRGRTSQPAAGFLREPASRLYRAA